MSRNREQHISITLTVALLTTIAEATLTFFLFKNIIGLGHLFIIHAAICLLLSAWPLLTAISRKDQKLPLLFLMLTLTMGVFGAGICVAATLLSTLYSRKLPHEIRIPIYTWLTDTTLSHETIASHDASHGEQDSLVPYMDIMILGTEKQKKAALDTITTHFSPEFTPVLMKAIQDRNNAIRMQAATILARLEQSFSRTVLALENTIQKRPHSPKTTPLILKLAIHYEAYANAGIILDKERERALRHKAILIYEHYLERVPHDTEALFRLSSLYLKNGKLDESHTILTKTIHSEQTLTTSQMWHYMECLYYKRDFTTLRHVARACFPSLNPDDPNCFQLIEMVRLWGGGIIEPSHSKGGRA